MWVWAPQPEGLPWTLLDGMPYPKKNLPLRFEFDIILAVTRGVENLPLFFHVWLRISKITRKGPLPKSYGQFERPSGCNPAFQAAKRQLQHLRSRQHQMRGETQRLSQVPKHFAVQPDPRCVFLASGSSWSQFAALFEHFRGTETKSNGESSSFSLVVNIAIWGLYPIVK
jgi:hypothetical protein